MRILFMFDGLGRGGRERRFVQLVKGLNEAGYKDLYFINTRDIIEYKEILGYDIHVEFIDRHKKGFYKKLIHRINEIRPDVVQPWIDVNAAHLDIVYFFLKKKPVYISSFIADCNYFKHPLWSKVAMRISYWLSRYVISNSEAGLDSYGVKGKKRVCIHNGFDFDRLENIRNKDIKEELAISTKCVVSMIARMQQNKDFSMYIKAAEKILTIRNDVTFLAVGGGPMEKVWRQEVPTKLKNKIIFTGRRDDVDEILNVTDICVLCSNADVHGEGVSNTILESMAFGLPVIATDGGGTGEIVENNSTGFLIKPKDVKGLVERIIQLLDDVELRKNMGQASAERIGKYFSLEYSTRQYIDLYKSIEKNETYRNNQNSWFLY